VYNRIGFDETLLLLVYSVSESLLDKSVDGNAYLRSEGTDPVVGVLETHDWSITSITPLPLGRYEKLVCCYTLTRNLKQRSWVRQHELYASNSCGAMESLGCTRLFFRSLVA
jgi:hypothetical protein